MDSSTIPGELRDISLHTKGDSKEARPLLTEAV